jgi:integrase
VKTSKTGEVVQIPILPLLQGVLEKLPANDSPYAFPEQAAKYEINPDNITLRARKVMRAAGFFDPEDAETAEEKKTTRGEIHQVRANGLRKASVRDFHSFRVTWVTLALSAGVPLEIVQKVTGHRTAAIVLKHYFQPGREDYRRSLTDRLPAVLSGTSEVKPFTLAEIREQVVAMKPRTWKKIRQELLGRLPVDPKEAKR